MSDRTKDRHLLTASRQDHNRLDRHLKTAGGRRRRYRGNQDYPIRPVDGEGFVRADGTSYYGLLAVLGLPTLFTKEEGQPLGTEDCFRYLFDQRLSGAALVGFAFTYDAENILRDLPEEAYLLLLDRLPNIGEICLNPEELGSWPDGKGGSLFNWRWKALEPGEVLPRPENHVLWHGWEITFIPRKLLAISTTAANLYGPDCATPEKRFSRTIMDAQAYFGATTSLVAALTNYHIPIPEEITAGKATRNDFDWNNRDTIEEYNRKELWAMHRLFATLRRNIDAGLEEARATFRLDRRSWHGPGALAAKWLEQTGYSLLRPILHLPAEAVPAIETAIGHPIGRPRSLASLLAYPFSLSYFGGRIEQTGAGQLALAFDNDLNAAYNAAMLRLPEWAGTAELTITTAPQDLENLFRTRPVGQFYVRWHGFTGNLGPLPFREKGSVFFPLTGEGWVLSPEAFAVHDLLAGPERLEVLAAMTLPGTEGYGDGLGAPQGISNQEVLALFTQRMAMKQAHNPAEAAAKAILTSTYGKMIQQIGGTVATPPETFNDLAGGWCTSWTRAQVWRAVSTGNRDAVVTIQTDGFLSTEPLDLPQSNAIGEWKGGPVTNAVLVMPGVYTFDKGGRTVLKRRGFSKVIQPEQAIHLLETGETLTNTNRRFVKRHQSLRVKAYKDKAYQWVTATKTIGVDLHTKRQSPTPIIVTGGGYQTFPPRIPTAPYSASYLLAFDDVRPPTWWQEEQQESEGFDEPNRPS